MLRLIVVACVAACGGAPYHTVTLTNRTERAIEQVYLYPNGAAEHGASRATLAPNGSAQVQVRAGNVDVLAISAKVELDEHTRERRTATQTIELRGPIELVFHDSNQPAGPLGPNAVGVAFRVGE